MGIIVELADAFTQRYPQYPKDDRLKITHFISHVEQHGYDGLTGKIGPSDNIPQQDPNRRAKIRYAKRYHLWHYHIGIPRYLPARHILAPYQTSEYVLHFMKFPGGKVIRIVDLDYHDPMTLPPLADLFINGKAP